jgi:diguanylate cyclase (GGDEF)-like protein
MKRVKSTPTPTSTSDKSKLQQADALVLIDALRHENEELRKQLDHVVATASNNERIWRHFAEIERILLSTRQLDLLVDELLREIKTRFRPDQVVLLISHPDVLERFFPGISQENGPIADGTWILPVPAHVVDSLCGDSIKPLLLSPGAVNKLLPFVPEEVSRVQSGVFIPLRIGQIPFGGLFLGSIDAGHYRPRDGTDLLEQLGIKIVLCMDNCLTYERTKDFAVQDAVTGLLNFFQIHTVLEKELRKAKRQGTPLSVLMIDLSFYHDVDDYFDEMGNLVLKHVADMLKDVLPERECVLGRYGSDEFLLLLPDVQEEEAREVVPYLTQRIRKTPFKHHNTAVLIQATIGVGALKDHMKRSQDLLDDAYAELCRLKILRHQPGK